MNVGNEQNKCRPVVVLQNNTGNINSNTTVIAPVTTHQTSACFDEMQNRWYVERNENGRIAKKYLGFYEIPLKLEGENAESVFGLVNVAQIRVIDRKRIVGAKKGVATQECFNAIKTAIERNLR